MKMKYFNFILASFTFSLAISSISSAQNLPTAILDPKESFVLPGQSALEVGFLDNTVPGYLSSQSVHTAIENAVNKWNAAFGRKLQLMKVNFKGVIPTNKLFISIEFSTDPRLFSASGNELGYTTTCVYQVRRIAQGRIMLNNTPAMSADPFSTNGAIDSTYDLELVVMHELGHAIGFDHAPNSPRFPPVMSPKLGTNRELNQWTGKPISELRKIYPDDVQLLGPALKKREKYEFEGTYEGTLQFSFSDESGNQVTRDVKFSNFKITQTSEKVLLEFQGNKAQASVGIDFLLFNKQQKDSIELQKEEGWIESVKFKKADTGLEVIELSRIVAPSNKIYKAKGFLKKISS